MEVMLREYREGDLEAMYALDVICFEPVFRFTKRAMRRFAEARGALTVLAEAQPEPGEAPSLAGFSIVQTEDRVGYVVTLDVAPAFRRQGLAARLMQHVEMQVQAAGGGAMELHVHVGNTGAVRFYERIGYKPVGRVDGFYGRGFDALVYRKGLAPRS